MPDPDGSVQPLLSDDPWWLMLIKALMVFVILLLLTLFAIWFERRVVGRMQHRPGPNVNGPFGLLQSLADAVKLHFKEGIIPARADKFVFIAAPVMSAIPAFLIFSIIPVGGEVTMFGQQTALQLTDPPVGVLVALALASVGVYGIVLGGWASGSTYPILGGLRAAAQMISYDVAMGLSFVAVFLYAGTLSTSAIVTQQEPGWYIWLLPVSFIVYCVSMVGETNRAPFDMAEAEGELVGGFNTEYSSMRFGLFFLAEYINMINVSAIAVTLFLGGWRAPWPFSLLPWANQGYWTHALVLHQGAGLHVRLRLAPRQPAPGPVRPVHVDRLEGADPGLAGLDRAGRIRPGAAQLRGLQHRRGAAVGGHPVGRCC